MAMEGRAGKAPETPLMAVLPLKTEETHEWLKNVHYAKRIPIVNYAFGFFTDNRLEGVITYGQPPSQHLCEGIAGKSNASLVLELNRLVFRNPIKNGPSELVGQSLRMLPKPTIVVSFADIGQGHVGYIYQATNFLYTGLSAKRKDWKIKGMENLHSRSISAMAEGQENPAEWLRQRFGDDFYAEERPRKHRYIYICANKKDRKRIQAELLYSIEPYPKGDSQRYDISYQPTSQGQLF